MLDTTKNGERREIPIDDTLEELFNQMPHIVKSVYVFTDQDGILTNQSNIALVRHVGGQVSMISGSMIVGIHTPLKW